MTRIHDIIRSFRDRRAKLNNSDSVSFESFCKDSPEKNHCRTKESSIDGDFEVSPIHRGDNYAKLTRPKNAGRHCNRPGIVSIIIYLFFMGIILMLFVVLLLHSFGVVTVYNNSSAGHTVSKDKEHYEPSAKVHQELSKQKPMGLPQPPKPDYKQCMLLKDPEKFDCYPQQPVNRSMCEARGCCWIPAKTKPANKDVPLYVPYCFYPPNYNTYNYINVTETAFGLEAFLKREFLSSYPQDLEVIKMTVKFETENRLHVKISDPSHNRFEPPYPEVPMVDKAANNLSYIFLIDPTKPGFEIIRRSFLTTIFDTTFVNNLIFSNQFLQLSAKLPSKYIYGLGEHKESFLLPTNWSRYTMFNADKAPIVNSNLYGSHPFYLMMEDSGNSHGVLLFNSNAMDVILQPAPAITFRTIGGVLSFYYFLGPTPADVISQYTDLIGRPYLPPYWALGFHLCRFNYGTLNRTKEIMMNNVNAGIPLDTQWNDLDYMKNQNMFTYDTVKFGGLPQFVKELHDNGMHYIPLIDPGISAAEPKGTYPPFDKGLEMNIFVKNSSGLPFTGKVWNPVATVWPDFTHPDTVNYWTMMLKSFHDKVPFDGAWIDMNEPSNFKDGDIHLGCAASSLETPPYVPAVGGGHLNYKTMCMSAQHYAGLHYDLHNLFGITEGIVTNFALANIRGKRPMVISRSTFVGQGHFTGHWSGDVFSTWEDLKYSIPDLLSFSLFGIPLMGADICGFNGNTTVPLCARWSQLGAFYPFSRNHNTDDGIDQDPVSLGEPVTTAARNALTVRYSLLPYLYTLFWSAHVYGDTVARPLFFEFPGDKNTYALDEQFLWGPAVMIIPVLKENAVEVDGYVPAGLWYNYHTKESFASGGAKFTFNAPMVDIPVLVRGGHIIPQQNANQTTTASRKNKFDLLVAPDANRRAIGNLYWDDGDSLNSYLENNYTLLAFSMETGIIKTKATHWGFKDTPNLGSVTVLGLINPVTEVTINGVVHEFSYDTVHKTLLIKNVDVSLEKPNTIAWK